ncbi:transporter substrate-binding domain-containing protein [Alteromonas sp. KUL49]|uniref:substrate-binding periplasmic protein n=1 Tax=Alteromonas sp. KUL49 TaxID=2480798 RepID=UPI00102EFA86|nr:transporter substrate-binding domain-containing protein [Alteromonas sp. KUL49]TAP40118.1 transporter substrate-binding domain-containing protein [Alteromonas sp. KUL49]GEA11231.1 hypothetical protein KUL49_16060 [Alteromonas sp. KUL49]
MQKYVLVCVLVTVLSFVQTATAKDIVIVNKRHSEQDTRSFYPYEILETALTLSEEKYGDYEIKVAEALLPNNRTIDMLSDGDYLNVVMVVTTKEWEEKTIPIRIPLRKGVLAYRLLAVKQQSAELFASIHSAEQLKKQTVGLHRNWATWDIMTHLDFPVASVYSYEALFGMLEKGRFDYIPRGVHEIYDELSVRKTEYPNLSVAPKIALYIPSPFYMFVSPKYPRLAERLTWGLEKMVKNGMLDEIFDKHYRDSILESRLHERHVINIGNPLLPEQTPLERPELWLDLSRYRD